MSENVIKDLWKRLESTGFRGVLIPVERLGDLKGVLNDLRSHGALDPGFVETSLTHFDFELPADFPQASSIILTAARQPRIRVGFVYSGKDRSFIVPPTYDYSTDGQVLDIISTCLGENGYVAKNALLPWKTLATRCGLARYGRNNIAYLDGWGSLVRLRGFYSDLPADRDPWGAPAQMAECDGCKACLQACPSGAIGEERFLIRAERCMTYFNEGTDDFPAWIDPEWHNCLVGCMICQDACPLNRSSVTFETESIDFTEEETRKILDAVPVKELLPSTVGKLEATTLFYGYENLPRNLSVLLRLKA
jgi:epoxyqueuosine reductase